MMIEVKDKNYGEDDCKVAIWVLFMTMKKKTSPDTLKYYQKEKHLPIGRACCLEYSKSIVSDFHQI